MTEDAPKTSMKLQLLMIFIISLIWTYFTQAVSGRGSGIASDDLGYAFGGAIVPWLFAWIASKASKKPAMKTLFAWLAAAIIWFATANMAFGILH